MALDRAERMALMSDVEAEEAIDKAERLEIIHQIEEDEKGEEHIGNTMKQSALDKFIAPNLGLPINDSKKVADVAGDFQQHEDDKGWYESGMIGDSFIGTTVKQAKNVWEGLKILDYYGSEALIGTSRGAYQGLSTALSGVGDITGIDTFKEWGDNAEDYLDKTLMTTSSLGDVSETIGRIGTGLFLTRGMGKSRIARTGQGAIIDGFMFSGDEGNIADMLKDMGVDNSLNDFLATEEDDSEVVKRLKNAMGGAGVGLAVDTIIDIFSYGKKLYNARPKTDVKLEGDELAQEVLKLVTDDAKALMAKQADELPVIKPTVDTAFVKVPVNEGDELLAKADELIAGVQQNVDMKQPLNAEKIAEGSEVFARTVDDVEPDIVYKSHEDTLIDIDKALVDKIGEDSFNLMDDMMQTAKKVEDLDVNLGQSRVIVGTLAKALDDSIKIAQKENTVSSMVMVLQNMKNLRATSTILKNTQGSIARAMSSMRIDTMNSDMKGTLSLLDAIDPDNAMMRLETALGKNDMKSLTKFMDDLSDTTKNLKDKVEKIDDSLYTKVTNALSESTIASMLSAPSTLAVNVIGNSIVKTQSIVQDTAQFVWGRIIPHADRMRLEEYKALMHSNIGQNLSDTLKIGKNLIKWGRSGFKDEAYDASVLVPFKTDQDFAHKYIDPKYWRGEVKGQGGFFNNAITVTGRAIRSPYNMIGYVDDYYKRGAFRAELIRQGSKIARARNVTGKDYNTFINKFIHANTELRMIANQGKNSKPTEAWLVKNQEFVGQGNGLHKYVDTATDNANLMTFQKDLGDGIVGKSVKLLNSDGLLRMIVPFKLTPINILKNSVSTAMAPVSKQLYKDIASGGGARDIALAKISTSVGIMYGLSTLISDGRVMGTYRDDAERVRMQNAGIPELAVKVGDKWFEFKQVEPLATILGVMTDMDRLSKEVQFRLTDAEMLDQQDAEYASILADGMLSIANNITSKTYAKSLAEGIALATGESSLVDYSGKLISSMVPFSSAINYTGRVTNEGFKKEAKTFMEKVRSKFRWSLDRDALDAYGRPIKEIEYALNFTIKEYDANDPAHAGAREVARLKVSLGELPTTVSLEGLSVKLDEKQHWKMRRSLDTKFKLTERLNKHVSTEAYKAKPKAVQKIEIETILTKIRASATKYIFKDVKARKDVYRQAEKLKKEIARPQGTRTTYEDLITKE